MSGRLARPPAAVTTGSEPAPRRPLDNLRVAILFFIGAESMFFAALISALFVLRASLPVWPPPLQPRLPIGVTTANTVVLLASSVAMILAGRALTRIDRREVVRWLSVAAALGALFLVVQGVEWVRLIRHGLTLSSSTYGTTFYTLIGTHALHVAGALAWLVATRGAGRRGDAPGGTADRWCAAVRSTGTSWWRCGSCCSWRCTSYDAAGGAGRSGSMLRAVGGLGLSRLRVVAVRRPHLRLGLPHPLRGAVLHRRRPSPACWRTPPLPAPATAGAWLGLALGRRRRPAPERPPVRLSPCANRMGPTRRRHESGCDDAPGG